MQKMLFSQPKVHHNVSLEQDILMHLLKRTLFIFPAFIAAIFYLVPNFGPLFTPVKGPAANHADFVGQMFFFYSVHVVAWLSNCSKNPSALDR